MKLCQAQTPKLLYLSNINAGSLPKAQYQKMEAGEMDGGQVASADYVDRLPRELVVSKFDLFCFAFSMGTYLLDIGTDLIVAYIHYDSQRYWACFYIALLAIVPSVLLNLVSILWWMDDTAPARTGLPSRWVSRRSMVFRIMFYIFQLGPLLWYLNAFSAGLKFRKAQDQETKRRLYCEMVMADRDASLMRFFEAFLESIPQVLIQGIVLSQIISGRQPWESFSVTFHLQLISIFASLLSACWSVSIQHRNLRIARQDKANMNALETALQLLWRFFTISSRYLCLVLFAIAFRYWIAVVFVIHYSLSVLHITLLQSMSINLEMNSSAIRVGLVLICAAVHLFAPFNMAEGPTRWRYFVAYVGEALEDMILVVLALNCKTLVFPMKHAFAVAAAVFFVVGISVMLLYYLKFHPNRRRPPLAKAVPEGLGSEVADVGYVPLDLKHVDSDVSLDLI